MLCWRRIKTSDWDHELIRKVRSSSNSLKALHHWSHFYRPGNSPVFILSVPQTSYFSMLQHINMGSRSHCCMVSKWHLNSCQSFIHQFTNVPNFWAFSSFLLFLKVLYTLDGNTAYGCNLLGANVKSNTQTCFIQKHHIQWHGNLIKGEDI